MQEPHLDKIAIKDLLVRCVIGIFEEERRTRQDVLINMTLHTDLRQAGQTDRIEDSVDYKALKKRVLAMAEASSFFLVERLAERAAEICLEDERVRRVTVSVEKPGAARFSRSVGVEIVREQKPDARTQR
ncbi:MAG: dihydroneopterin aldolase [Kiritimatiellae bacterium]|nr:dihydroneopterin aldolase [Kiritimatiellia bacterium]